MPRSEDLLAWYENQARSFLLCHAAERVPALDGDAARLRRAALASDEFVVCFLGNAGVGKSTLLNALAAGDRHVVPAGGVGPLTAMATTVRYGEVHRFTAHYHDAKVLWKLTQTLMLAHERQEHTSRQQAGAEGKPEGSSVAADPEDVPDLADEDAREVAEEATATVAAATAKAEDGDEGSVAGSGSRLESAIKQAKQLVTGDQDAAVGLPYLVDRLRSALGRKPKYGTEPDPRHADNVTRLAEALASAASGHPYECSGPGAHFRSQLTHHAAGHLSPMIKKIEVAWPAELLRSGVVLVDLPGVGVANDAYREVTQVYVREQAKAVVVVANRAGMTEAVVDLIRTSGYWNRLVGDADVLEHERCNLLLAITQVDDVADEEWSKSKDLPRDERPTRRSVYAEQVERLIERCRRQTSEQLQRLSRTSENTDVDDARTTAARHILDTLEVHPVSAPEYRRIVAEDDDDRPRMLKEADETGIPKLSQALQRLAADQVRRRRKEEEAVHQRLLSAINDELTVIESHWRSEDRASGEAERLRAELEDFLAPARRELANRQGAFREFLQQTVEERIDSLVAEAREVAERDVRSYLIGLQSYHWMTLRAAVQRGGTFAGANHVDLPGDISDYFQEPMAGVWSVKLLRFVRKRTKDYADDCVHYVDQACEWAREQGARVKPALVDVQQDRVRSRAAQLNQVGKEAADELRDTVRKELHRAIAPHIRRRCEEFVRAGDAVGRGVKYRILQLFNELAHDSTKAAEAPTRNILKRRFEEVREQIDAAFSEWGDPLDETVNALAVTHEQRLRRSDAQRRGGILQELDAIRRSQPVLDPSDAGPSTGLESAA